MVLQVTQYGFTRRGYRFHVLVDYNGLYIGNGTGALTCRIRRVAGGADDQFETTTVYDILGPIPGRPKTRMMLTYNPFKSHQTPDVNTVEGGRPPQLNHGNIDWEPTHFFGMRAAHFQDDSWGEGSSASMGRNPDGEGNVPREYEQDPHYTKQFDKNFSLYDHQQQLPLTSREQAFMDKKGLVHDPKEWKNQTRAAKWRRPTEYQTENEYMENAEEVEQFFQNAYSNYNPVQQHSVPVVKWTGRIRSDPYSRGHFDERAKNWEARAANEQWVSQYNVNEYPSISELPNGKRAALEQMFLEKRHPFRHQMIQSNPNLRMQDPQNYRAMNHYWHADPWQARAVQTKESLKNAELIESIFPSKNTNSMPMSGFFRTANGFGSNRGWGGRR